MRTLRVAVIVVLSSLVGVSYASAQALTLSLFERYLGALREQAAIPGLSGALVQNGAIVKEWGLGRQDVEGNLAARSDTPYQIGGLTQALSASVLLRTCVQEGTLVPLDPVREWLPSFPDGQSTVAHLLAHVSAAGEYRYDPGRFAALGSVVSACTNEEFRRELVDSLFKRFAMNDSVPGASLGTQPTGSDIDLFTGTERNRYAEVMRRVAVPYRVDTRGRAIRSEIGTPGMNAATGVVSTVNDLVRFDLALRANAVLSAALKQQAWSRVGVGGSAVPTGLGWFVQAYNGETVVWQYGLIKDAYSSLIIKLPNRDLTLILLANSDGLSAPFNFEAGDVTRSPFAQLFFRLIAP